MGGLEAEAYDRTYGDIELVPGQKYAVRVSGYESHGGEYFDLDAFVRPDGDQDGVVALVEQGVEVVYAVVEAQIHAQVYDHCQDDYHGHKRD